MGNISVKLFYSWTRGSGGDVVQRHYLSRALVASMFGGANNLCYVCRYHHEEQFCEIILNLDKWFRMRCRLKVVLI